MLKELLIYGDKVENIRVVKTKYASEKLKWILGLTIISVRFLQII
mgnify:CR=1 FL=1